MTHNNQYTTKSVYMLGTDLKLAAHFKAVQTYLKPSGRFRSRPDGLRVVQTASKLHSDPMQGYKRRRRYKYDPSELDFATPASSEPVSRGALSYSQKAE